MCSAEGGRQVAASMTQSIVAREREQGRFMPARGK